MVLNRLSCSCKALQLQNYRNTESHECERTSLELSVRSGAYKEREKNVMVALELRA